MNRNDIKCWTFIIYCSLFVEYFFIRDQRGSDDFVSQPIHEFNNQPKYIVLFSLATEKSISIKVRRGSDRMILI
jgi:hypothetical protein